MEQYICTDCLDDDDLNSVIEEHAVEEICSFCGQQSGDERFVSDVDPVLERIESCIREKYWDAANSLPYESAEGGYQGQWYDTYDLVRDVVGVPALGVGEESILEMVTEHLGDQTWCKRSPFAESRGEGLKWDWDRLVEQTKHSRRFFLEADVVPPAPRYEERRQSITELLGFIAAYCEEFSLYETLPVGTRLYRARPQASGKTHDCALALGQPPREKATQANRMTPPGVVASYFAGTAGGAVQETMQKNGTCAVGVFRTLRPVRILNLFGLHQGPGFFSTAPRNDKEEAWFLRLMGYELSRPIARDKSTEHLDYLPTQVFTEYFRYCVHRASGEVEGIQYPSTHNRTATNYCLFFDRYAFELDEGSRELLGENGWVFSAFRFKDPVFKLEDVATAEVSFKANRWGRPEADWVLSKEV